MKPLVIQKPFVLVGMEEAFLHRFQAQLGLLDAVDVTLRTPQVLVADTIPANDITIMVYQDCLPYLQEQMATGTAPGTALQRWIQQAEVFLRALRARRASVFPVALDIALGDPDALRTALIDAYACVFRNDAPGPTHSLLADDPAFGFLANTVFTKSTAARRLQAELDASGRAIGARPVRETSDVDVIFHDLAAARVAQSDLVREVGIKTEFTALKEREAQTAKSRSTQIEKQMAQLKADHARVQGTLHEQVRWARSELRTAMIQIDDGTKKRGLLADKVAVLRETVEARDAHIEAIRVSTSWRLTGPLRRVRRLFWQR